MFAYYNIPYKHNKQHYSPPNPWHRRVYRVISTDQHSSSMGEDIYVHMRFCVMHFNAE
jgi:hypothetical protein